MNILITCSGRAYAMMNVFREEFSKAGFGTIGTANRDIMSSLYAADKAYIVPSIGDQEYIPALLEICHKEEVKAVFVIMDEDLLVISKAAEEFRKNGVIPIVVDYEVAQICDNKYSMYEFLIAHGYKCAATYSSIGEFQVAYENKEIDFPVFTKPVVGAGSRGAMKCNDMEELKLSTAINSNLIIQEFMDGPEYSVEVYMDTVSGQMVSAFAKVKITKSTVGTAGTAVGKTVKDAKLFSLSEQLAQSLGARGPLNIEFFEIDGEYYVGEVNPRFGGNYYFAHACGVDFVSLIINNINGIQNPVNIGNYESGVIMFRYDNMIIKRPAERLSQMMSANRHLRKII